MATAEVEPQAVEAAPAVENGAAENGTPALPAKRIPRPVRPDDTETRAAIDILQQSIVKNKRRIEEIKEEIDGKRAGRGKGSAEQQAVKNKLAELRGQFQALVSQKNQLRSQLELASKARESARSSMKELRSSMKFTKVEEIDQHIAELEHRISHDSLSLNEEKKVLEQIKALKKSRGTIGELTSKVSQLEQDSSAVDGLREGIKGIDGAIDKIKAQEEVLRQELADMRAKEAERGSDIPALIQERDECREICKAAYQKIQDLRAELDAKWATYKEQNALFRVQLAEDRKRRQEEYLKQKAERDAERAARLAEQAPEPFDKEITMCDQLAAYLRKFVVEEAAAAEEEKRDLSGALEGFKPLQKKGIDEDDAWLLGGKKGGKGKAKAKKEEKKPREEKLVHSLDILEAFATLSVEVPTTRDAMPALLADVAAKKEHFLAKRQEAKDHPVEEPAAEEVAAEGEEAEAAEDAPKQKAKKTSKAAAPPKLDDAASWPSIGGAAAAPAPAAAAAPEEEEEEEEEGEVAAPVEAEEEPAAVAPAAGEAGPEATPAPAASAAAEDKAAEATGVNSAVAVKLSVTDDGSVSLALSA
ncbi:hypothetical protein ABPG77_004371 [Micractinium sp. CCAP 211/92]